MLRTVLILRMDRLVAAFVKASIVAEDYGDCGNAMVLGVEGKTDY